MTGECPACGAHLPEEAQFCSECGAEVAGAATAPTGQSQEAAASGETPLTQRTVSVGSRSVPVLMVGLVVVGAIVSMLGFATMLAVGTMQDDGGSLDGGSGGEGGSGGGGDTAGDGDTQTPEPTCEQVVAMGLPEQETETFHVEAGQYVRVEVDNNYGFRTHVVLRNPDEEIMLSEGVEDSNAWRVYDVESEDRVVEESAGEWTAMYTPADDSPQTSGDVTVSVCTP